MTFRVRGVTIIFDEVRTTISDDVIATVKRFDAYIETDVVAAAYDKCSRSSSSDLLKMGANSAA